jgi:GT2 family glycosyltransferase
VTAKPPLESLHNVGVVVIGRNEGNRLISCLKSVIAACPSSAVYVDSGSVDDSVKHARALGVMVAELDSSRPFTAARGRNTGARALLGRQPDLEYLQFVDGDCDLDRDWMAKGRNFLAGNPGYAAVAGRRRERFPQASVFNQMCDIEWNTAVGDSLAFGGDMLCRASAFSVVGGYDDDLIAGEDPDLSLRLRLAGWKLRRLPDEMTVHDADIRLISQWWKRTERSGFAFAAGAIKNWSLPGRPFLRQLGSSLFWGFAFPVLTVVLAFVNPWVLVIAAAAICIQVLKVRRYVGTSVRGSFTYAVAAVAGKVPEAVGAIRCLMRSVARRPARLIEYK